MTHPHPPGFILQQRKGVQRDGYGPPWAIIGRPLQQVWEVFLLEDRSTARRPNATKSELYALQVLPGTGGAHFVFSSSSTLLEFVIATADNIL